MKGTDVKTMRELLIQLGLSLQKYGTEAALARKRSPVPAEWSSRIAAAKNGDTFEWGRRRITAAWIGCPGNIPSMQK